MGMKTKHRFGTFFYHLFICGFGLIMIYPVLWMISGAFKNNMEILNGGLKLLPPSWRFENFTTAGPDLAESLLADSLQIPLS